jgi:hypothetical protein
VQFGHTLELSEGQNVANSRRWRDWHTGRATFI